MHAKRKKKEALTDAQLAILDRLTIIMAEQDCMIRETQRAIRDLSKRKRDRAHTKKLK